MSTIKTAATYIIENGTFREESCNEIQFTPDVAVRLLKLFGIDAELVEKPSKEGGGNGDL
jgi:plasmid maintenance system antidote protein VapI